jgi:hypothetical protein
MAYETVNPATGQCLRRFEEHSDTEVSAALNAAQSAYRTWRRESFEGRARLVHRVADLMRERIEPLSALITQPPVPALLDLKAGCPGFSPPTEHLLQQSRDDRGAPLRRRGGSRSLFADSIAGIKEE